MSNMLDIHSCTKVLYENELLKKKLKKLKDQNRELHEQLETLQSIKKQQQLGILGLGKRSIEVQTEPPKSWMWGIHPQPAQAKRKDVDKENQQVNKLISMNSNIMRRYEKELKTNMQHMETITKLNLRVNELERKLKEAQMEIGKVKFENKKLEEKFIGSKSKGDISMISGMSVAKCTSGDCRREMRKLQKQRDRLEADKLKLKQELEGLDNNFFEEIEDIKYALQQSAILNKEYEKSLRKICRQFGVPYPNPEGILQDR